MKVLNRSLMAGAALGLSLLAGGPAAAQQAGYIDFGDSDRFKVYQVASNDAADYVENNRAFLLDSYTGEVYVRIGAAEAWTSFIKPHDVAAFPKGGAWTPPRFSLAIARAGNGAAKLLLTNLGSGARYTRSAGGEWTPFRHPVVL